MVEHMVEVLHQEEVWVVDMQGDNQGYKLIYLLVSIFLILSLNFISLYSTVITAKVSTTLYKIYKTIAIIIIKLQI